MSKKLTNEQFMRELMAGALTPGSGVLVQLFILDALAKVADAVADSAPKDYPENGIVHPAAWVRTGKEVKSAIDDHLAR